ncbi:MAG: glycosyltransferase [Wenzhouxiangella sp.]|nr:MAG: glycosyltransferase [Wenzhouxiangella sp.]
MTESGFSNHRLVIIGSVWPEPKSSAAGTRMMQLIALLKTVFGEIVFASPATRSIHRTALDALGVQEADIRLNCSSFDDWLIRLQPAAVIFDRFMSEEQFGWRVAQNCPSALRILDTEDLHSLRAVRGDLLKQGQKKSVMQPGRSLGPVSESPDQLYKAMAANDLTLRELASIYRSDLSLMISEFEMNLLTEQFHLSPALLHYLPLFAKVNDSPGLSFSERRDFVSIGNFRHPPNWDAVLWLKDQLWPAIRAQLPEAKLHLYGAYPPPRATALNNVEQGFLVRGHAEDAHQVLSTARVCLAPLRFGAGLKGKLLDAMACRTPSITTSIGAEGIMSTHAWPGAVCDDPADFINAAVRLHQDQAGWESARSLCAGLLQARFSQDAFSAAFRQRIEQLITQLKEHRAGNIVGAMLNHHQHQSTRYMARWIEAKNRTR